MTADTASGATTGRIEAGGGESATSGPPRRETTRAVAAERSPVPPGLKRLDERVVAWMAAHAITVSRLALGVVFLWFGVLKFFPGYSPAEGLAARTIHDLTFGLVAPDIALRVLAAWETLIGLGLLTAHWLRATLLLFFLQIPGTFLPLVLYPDELWHRAPISLTLEGQYIVKNSVLLGAALAVGATVRGGRLAATASDGSAIAEESARAPAADGVGNGRRAVAPR